MSVALMKMNFIQSVQNSTISGTRTGIFRATFFPDKKASNIKKNYEKALVVGENISSFNSLLIRMFFSAFYGNRMVTSR